MGEAPLFLYPFLGALLALLLSAPSLTAADIPGVSQQDVGYWRTHGYQIVSKLGEGYRAEAFKAIRFQNNQMCVLKVFRPEHMRQSVIKREVDASRRLSNGPNFLKLIEVLDGPGGKDTVLSFEWGKTEKFKDLFPTLTDHDFRFYSLELMKALDYIHGQNFAHLDIKPNNILIDHANRTLRVIDFGRAEFIQKGMTKEIYPGWPPYDPPELLVRLPIDIKVDIWGAAQTIASMILRKDDEPFVDCRNRYFRLPENRTYAEFQQHQLQAIARFRGSAELVEFLKSRNAIIDDLPRGMSYEDLLGTRRKKSWTFFTDPSNRAVVSAELFDLLDRMFQCDPAKRLTAKEAIDHPYFDPVRGGLDGKGGYLAGTVAGRAPLGAPGGAAPAAQCPPCVCPKARRRLLSDVIPSVSGVLAGYGISDPELASRLAGGEAAGHWVTRDVVEDFWSSLISGPVFQGMDRGERAWALEEGLRNTIAAQEAAGGGSSSGCSEGGMASGARDAESDSMANLVESLADLVDELPYLYNAAGANGRESDGSYSDAESESASESESDTAALDQSDSGRGAGTGTGAAGHRGRSKRGGSGSGQGRMDGASGF